MSYFDSSEEIHCISAQKKSSLFNKAKKEHALPSTKKKKIIFYMIESFKVSVMFIGLKTCRTYPWKVAKHSHRRGKMNSALFAVIMPGLWACCTNRPGSCQCAGSSVSHCMHDASVLPGRHPKLCCIILIPFVKMPLFLFLFEDLTKAPAISCPTVLSINCKWGGKRGRNHKTQKNPQQFPEFCQKE